MRTLAAIWSGFAWLFRILWACRVPVASAVLGLWLFGTLVQAQNLLSDTSWNTSPGMAVLYWTLFFAAVFVVWAFPIHYAARRTLRDPTWLLAPYLRAELGEQRSRAFSEDVARRHGVLVLWVPRILGLLPFAAITLGLVMVRDTVKDAAGLHEGAQARYLTGILLVADAVTAACFLAFILLRRSLVRTLERRLDRDRGGRMRFGRGVDLMARLSGFSVLITFGLFAVAYGAPVWLSAWVPRAALVPFLLGSLVLPLSWVADHAHRTGLPLLAGLLAACVLVTAANRSFNDLRVIDAGPEQRAGRQIDVTDAVARWKAANGCASPVDERACPPALIVAAEGGASRAAFMAATAVGAILDRQGELGADTADDSPGRRIFAISGVSGGALGAATIRAALADSEIAGTGRHAPPCRFAPRTWFRAPAAFANQPGLVESSWRYCLQALTSGDYLSPSMVGLAFRDNLAPSRWLVGGPSLIADRAVLLEEAFERHYDSVVFGGNSVFGTGSSCSPGSTTGLCRRFGYAAALEASTAWVPLLLLNGTSVQTGRRVVASDLSSTWAPPGGGPPRALYPEAYDLFEAMSTAHPQGQSCADSAACASAAAVDGPDLLLSTAALASARFPVISPAGSFRPRRDGTHGDRVVDGGYFENAGLTTARDVAAALRIAGVVPLILWVGNDPEVISTDVVPPRPADTPSTGVAGDQRLLVRAFGLLAAPLDALVATRQGHGVEAARLAAETAPPRVFKLQVFDTARLEPDLMPDPADLQRCNALLGMDLRMTKVSMSWWLSPAVQADLDAQLCDARNRQTLAALVAALRSRPDRS